MNGGFLNQEFFYKGRQVDKQRVQCPPGAFLCHYKHYNRILYRELQPAQPCIRSEIHFSAAAYLHL